MSQALIIANGTLPPALFVRRLAKCARYVVCADGGSAHAFRLHIRPDIILGDLDSHRFSRRGLHQNIPILHLPDQNKTDLEKAIEYLISRNYNEINIVGAFGDRIDHGTVALGCFLRYRRRARLHIFDQQGKLTFVDRRTHFNSTPGDRISLIPLNRCTGVTTRGLRYALRSETLAPGIRDGVSNEAIGTHVFIRCSRGVLLLYRPLPADVSLTKEKVR